MQSRHLFYQLRALAGRQYWYCARVGIPLLKTIPANGTHSLLPSAKVLGLNFAGSAWKALSTQSAMASGCGGIDGVLDEDRKTKSVVAVYQKLCLVPRASNNMIGHKFDCARARSIILGRIHPRALRDHVLWLGTWRTLRQLPHGPGWLREEMLAVSTFSTFSKISQ